MRNILTASFLALLLLGCSDPKVVGYKTTTVFIEDEPISSISPTINQFTESGWEIKSTRRAWEKGFKLGEQRWGTEYTLQKPIYEE